MIQVCLKIKFFPQFQQNLHPNFIIAQLSHFMRNCNKIFYIAPQHSSYSVFLNNLCANKLHKRFLAQPPSILKVKDCLKMFRATIFDVNEIKYIFLGIWLECISLSFGSILKIGEDTKRNKCATRSFIVGIKMKMFRSFFRECSEADK